MNKSTIVMLILVIILFIPNLPIGGGESDININKYSAEGYVAYVVNSFEKKQDEGSDKRGPDPDINKCVCDGTGIITHGDGHTTPCPYHSKNETPKVKPVNKQILFFTMKGCGPCARFKSSEIPSLKKTGWKVSESKDAMIRILDIAKCPDLWNKYKSSNSVPQFVLVVNGKRVKTMVGFNTATQIANLYNNM